MRIGLDVDGVLYQWSPQVRHILKTKYGVDLPESKNWNFLKEHTPAPIWKRLWKEDIYRMYLHGPLYPGSQEAVRQLTRHHEVYLITAAPELVRVGRTHHLITMFPDISGIVFVPILSSDKTFVECDVYLDDKVETTEITAKKRPLALSLLQDRPWNAEVTTPEGVIRVHDWKEIIAIVDDVAALKEGK